MPKVTRKMMVNQVNGEGGCEVEVTCETFIFAVFTPLQDLTAYELAQARAVIGECRYFMEEEWSALGLAQRHWNQRSSRLGPGYIQHNWEG